MIDATSASCADAQLQCGCPATGSRVDFVRWLRTREGAAEGTPIPSGQNIASTPTPKLSCTASFPE